MLISSAIKKPGRKDGVKLEENFLCLDRSHQILVSFCCCTSVFQLYCSNVSLSLGSRSIQYTWLLCKYDDTIGWQLVDSTILILVCFWIYLFPIFFLSEIAILKKEQNSRSNTTIIWNHFPQSKRILYIVMTSKPCFNVHVIDAVVHNSSSGTILTSYFIRPVRRKEPKRKVSFLSYWCNEYMATI